MESRRRSNRFIKVIQNFRRVRWLLKESQAKGRAQGEREARKRYSALEATLRREHRGSLDDEITHHIKTTKQLRDEHDAELARVKIVYESQMVEVMTEYERKRLALIDQHRQELLDYKIQYDERCALNDEIKRDALAQAAEIKDGAQSAERFWRSQIFKLQEFQSSLMAVVRTISERYRHLQTDLSKAQVGDDMLSDLQKKFNEIAIDTAKNAPQIISDKKRKKA